MKFSYIGLISAIILLQFLTWTNALKFRQSNRLKNVLKVQQEIQKAMNQNNEYTLNFIGKNEYQKFTSQDQDDTLRFYQITNQTDKGHQKMNLNSQNNSNTSKNQTQNKSQNDSNQQNKSSSHPSEAQKIRKQHQNNSNISNNTNQTNKKNNSEHIKDNNFFLKPVFANNTKSNLNNSNNSKQLKNNSSFNKSHNKSIDNNKQNNFNNLKSYKQNSNVSQHNFTKSHSNSSNNKEVTHISKQTNIQKKTLQQNNTNKTSEKILNLQQQNISQKNLNSSNDSVVQDKNLLNRFQKKAQNQNSSFNSSSNSSLDKNKTQNSQLPNLNNKLNQQKSNINKNLSGNNSLLKFEPVKYVNQISQYAQEDINKDRKMINGFNYSLIGKQYYNESGIVYDQSPHVLKDIYQKSLTGTILARPITEEHYQLWKGQSHRSVFKDVKFGKDEIEQRQIVQHVTPIIPVRSIIQVENQPDHIAGVINPLQSHYFQHSVSNDFIPTSGPVQLVQQVHNPNIIIAQERIIH